MFQILMMMLFLSLIIVGLSGHLHHHGDDFVLKTSVRPWKDHSQFLQSCSHTDCDQNDDYLHDLRWFAMFMMRLITDGKYIRLITSLNKVSKYENILIKHLVVWYINYHCFQIYLKTMIIDDDDDGGYSATWSNSWWKQWSDKTEDDCLFLVEAISDDTL